MRSHLTARFHRLFAKLPSHVQEIARKNYALWKNDPAHPSLDFKKVFSKEEMYFIRIGSDWRALCQRSGDEIVWYWIGSHSEYDKLL